MIEEPLEIQKMQSEHIEQKRTNGVQQTEEKINVKQTFSDRKKLYIVMGIVISILVVAGIIVAVVLIVKSQKDKTNLFKNKSAIIVGAGSAGLSAAHQLNEKGMKVEILEARATHFGRIQKLDEKGWANFDVEMGAEELHYEDSWYGNQIKKQVPKTKERWQDYDKYVGYGQDPVTNLIKKIDDINKDTAHESHFAIFEKRVEDKTIKDQTMQQYLTTFNKYNANQNHIYNNLYGQEYGTTLDKVSTKGIGQSQISYDEDTPGYTFKVAHSDMLTKIFEKVIAKVKYNTVVTQINYENSKVKVTDTAGNTYEADYVIVCVPLTQLKKKAITFTPAVSASKQAAIDKLQMDPAVKLHFKFTERFWAEDTFEIIVKGAINSCWDGNQWRKNGSFVLTCLFMGANTADFEAQKDNYVNTFTTNLGIAYNKNVKPLLDSYRYKNWGAEPYIEGGYSLPGVDEGTSRVDLQKQINDKIFFAGEATHRFFFQTVNGAIDTGITAAKEIIKIIEK